MYRAFNVTLESNKYLGYANAQQYEMISQYRYKTCVELLIQKICYKHMK